MANAIQVMIVDDSDETRQSVRMLLGLAEGVEVIAEARDGTEALHKLSVVTPDVILMDVNMPGMDGVQATEKITMQYPQIAIIILSVQNDVEYVRKCMRAGARDYLFKPVTVEVLSSTVEEVYRATHQRQTSNAVALLTDRLVHKPHVLAFVSSKGGVGKTSIAANAAAAFSQQGKRTVLVDLDLPFGDVALFYNITPSRTILDLVRESDEIDPDVLDRYLVYHPSGVALLCAPKRPEESEYVTGAHVRVILQALKKRFDYVIVDTSTLANDVFFAVLDTADEYFMVSTLNLAVLKNNRNLLELLAELGYGTDRVNQIVNRATGKNGLKLKDANKILKTDIYWDMENDYHFVETSINRGVPFVIGDKQHRLSKQVYLFTARVEGERGARVSRRNPLKKLLSNR